MKYPSVPPELSMAFTIRTNELLPWEWAAFESDVMYQSRELRAIFDEATKEAKAQLAPAEELGQ